MKRFKKFLTEAEAPQPAVPTPDAAPVSPTSMPNPFWFGASPTQPAPTQQPNENPPPEEIDWDELRKKLDDASELMEEIDRIMRTLGYQAVIDFLRRMGILVPGNLHRDGFMLWMYQYFDEKYFRDFMKKYQYRTPEQDGTFRQFLKQFFERWFKNF